MQRALALGVLSLLVVGCADDGGSIEAPSTVSPSIESPSTVSPSTVSSSTVSSSTVSTRPTEPVAMPATVAVAELGYPRDLLDRGRVNVVVTRDGDESFVLLDHQLVIDGFEPEAPEERRVVMPGNGRRVAVQGIFGEVVDCDAPTPLAASLAVHYTFGDDPTVRAGAIELDDTAILADIRSRFCTARRVLAENDVVLGQPAVDDETFTLDLTIERRAGDAELALHAIDGTVLFGVESPFEQGAPERTLASGVDRLVVPLTFDVNRCDPHAVAETTRKKGLTLWIAVDGAAPQPVDVDITSIDDDLEVILDRCKARTGK